MRLQRLRQRGWLHIEHSSGIMAIKPRDVLQREIRHFRCHFRITRNLFWSIGQMEASLVVRRQGLHARRTRQPVSLVKLQGLSNVLPRALGKARRKCCPILDSLRSPLGHEGQHCVACVAQQRYPTDGPIPPWWTIKQAPNKRLINLFEDAAQLKMPTIEAGNSVRNVSTVGP